MDYNTKSTIRNSSDQATSNSLRHRKLAYDLDLENPMTGYMKDVIFSRILGHADIDDGETWKDCAQCWICDKWNKVGIEFSKEDEEIMLINRVENIPRGCFSPLPETKVLVITHKLID
mgnify:CR=1 FL=1